MSANKHQDLQCTNAKDMINLETASHLHSLPTREHSQVFIPEKVLLSAQFIKNLI